MTSTQQDVAEIARHLHSAGWVANHDGNVSARMSDRKRFVATPTATSKRVVEGHDLITVDIEGKILSGRKKLFGEWHLHAACYKARPDVNAVIHAHPVAATAFGVARKSLGTPPLPEIVVSLGANVPTLDYAMPKSLAQDASIAKALTDGDADAFLLAGNGVVTVGIDLEQALLRMELVEHWAKILVAAAALGGSSGGAQALPADDVKKLLEARTKAGLGRSGRR